MSEYQQIIENARNQFSEENYKEASKQYLEALKNVPDSKQRAIIWAELSWTFYKLNSFRQAIDAADNCLQIDPEYAALEDLSRITGFSYIGLSHDKEAIQYLEKSVSIDRSSEKQQTVLFELIKLYFKNQDYSKSEELIKECEGYFYQNKREYWLAMLFYKGFVYYYNNRLDESETVFEELLENAENSTRKATALFGLAFIAFNRQDYLKTINLCEAVTKNDESFFDMETIAFLTAASFHYLGRDDVFRQYYDQLLVKYPNGRYATELERLKAAAAAKE